MVSRSFVIISLIFHCIISCNNPDNRSKKNASSIKPEKIEDADIQEKYEPGSTLLILPGNPEPGEPFRVLATGGRNVLKAKISVKGTPGVLESLKSKSGNQLPYWRIDDFTGIPAGNYKVTLTEGRMDLDSLEFVVASLKKTQYAGNIRKAFKSWDKSSEAIYSAWINALFYGCDESASWPALHEVIRNKNQNFLHNYLSLGEDEPNGKSRLIMQPDCADNPFFLRAYFAWKLGLPFGYHLCDRGTLERNPRTGLWITNEASGPKTDPVLSFNAFLRSVMNDVHSGTARTGLDDDNSDYYPVALERMALLPGTVYADPYGHTFVIVGWIAQTRDHGGLLLAADAQPDGTVGIKRFWKGNFLFETSGVIGEPGFKAFRPITVHNNVLTTLKNKELTASSGFTPFSLQQKKMKSDVFYHTMERIINPRPLDPETALLGLIDALHEQLLVRVTSVANGEAWQQSHPGTIIPMPSSAPGIFLAGGQWENFSTPNRDLRLLIAMDAVLNFPDAASRSNGEFNTSKLGSPEETKKKLQSILEKKISELSISYTRTNGSAQKLTVGDILARKDAFEAAYNPNDGIEIRWGAPENSDEISNCRRHAPPSQTETMHSARIWFHKRLHPPT